jgi:TolB-like protein
VQAALRHERSLDVALIPPRAIAVAPFDLTIDDEFFVPLRYGLADLLATDLAKSAQLTVVERLNLDVLLRELDLAKTQRVDTTTAPRIGKLLGARRLVTGTLGQSADRKLSLNATVTDVSTSEHRGGTSAEAYVESILDAEKALALALFAELGVNLTPAERQAVEQRPTANLNALLAYGRAVQNEAMGDYGSAASSYAQAAALDPAFTAAQTRRVEATVRAREDGAIKEARQRQRAGPQRALALAADAVNRPGPGVTADAADPGFAGARKTLTIIISILIP